MALPVVEDTANAGHDSFLDIVANIVGILIILVMVAGVRVKNFSLDTAEPTEFTEQTRALQDDLALTESVRGDVFEISAQLKDVERETELRQIERDRLAAIVEAGRREVENRRNQLDEASQVAFDLSRKVAEANSELDRIERQRSQLENTPARPTLVKSYPTPLSKTVDENEAHFQLRGGRLVYIPLERLVEELKADAQRKLYKLKDLPEFAETVGPQGGFRLRYTMERKTVTPELAVATGMAGQYAQLKRWTLIPVSSDPGRAGGECPGRGFQSPDGTGWVGPRDNHHRLDLSGQLCRLPPPQGRALRARLQGGGTTDAARRAHRRIAARHQVGCAIARRFGVNLDGLQENARNPGIYRLRAYKGTLPHMLV